MEEKIFSLLQLDALKEVSNIGAGNAATSLATLLRHKVEMTVPVVNEIDISKICEKTKKREVFGIVVGVLGEIQGNILIVFEKEIAIQIIENLLGCKEKSITELGNSALSEMANVLSAGYINSMSEFTQLKITTSVPAISYDMLSAILETVFLESYQYDKQILDIETIFKREKNTI
ncbi:chemotaxis protein CheC, partial [uncultured Clostridium sp.]|uniref:chemotaxis protein CheC n=1 Tax=uncultured Clostridium sp. TaxID=59620 RepID=UPI0026155FD1